LAVAAVVVALGVWAPVSPGARPDSECGNGVAEPGEACDPGTPGMGIPADLRGKTCQSEAGMNAGELSCKPDCKVDDRPCYCEAGQKFPATGRTTSWWAGDDGDIRAGAPLSFTDNGDGTITDNNTGLMWEKKDDSGGIHDVDGMYSVSGAHAEFIDALNNTCDGEGLLPCNHDDICGAGGQCGLAGHQDWRMPNVKELGSIVNFENWGPAVSEEFNNACVPGCGVLVCNCTKSIPHWSSTSSRAGSGAVRYVHFGGGSIGDTSNEFGRPVRAVRGGL
jgi:hypothetical protein